MKYNLFLSIVLILSACSSADEKAIKDVEKSIANFEDSLRKHPSTSNAPKLELAAKYLDFQKQFPSDEKAPEYLDKAHMVYAGVGLYVKSAEIADQIIKDYPNYVNRAMVLESQASNYDMFLTPRDSAKVRYYYNMLIEENPDLDKEKKNQIVFRLKNNHLTLEEFISVQTKSLN